VIPSYLQSAPAMTWVPATFDCSVVTVDWPRGDNSSVSIPFDNCTYQLTPNPIGIRIE